MNRPVIAIVQARMGSTRLPGKVLAEVCGRPLLDHLVTRLKRATTVDEVAIATTDLPKDEPIRAFARSRGLRHFAGSEQDVLDRYVQAARCFGARTIVRITADCPLVDPDVVDRIVTRFLESGADAACNSGSFPDGLDVEVFWAEALEQAWRDARLGSEREHVGPYFWNHPELFNLLRVEWDGDLGHLRWTVDTPEDLAFVTEVFEELHEAGSHFGTAEILELLARRPDLSDLNSGIVRNAGYLKSLAQDAEAAAAEARK